MCGMSVFSFSYRLTRWGFKGQTVFESFQSQLSRVVLLVLHSYTKPIYLITLCGLKYIDISCFIMFSSHYNLVRIILLILVFYLGSSFCVGPAKKPKKAEDPPSIISCTSRPIEKLKKDLPDPLQRRSTFWHSAKESLTLFATAVNLPTTGSVHELAQRLFNCYQLLSTNR